MRAYLKLSVVVLSAVLVQWVIDRHAGVVDDAQLTARMMLFNVGVGTEAEIRAAADAWYVREQERWAVEIAKVRARTLAAGGGGSSSSMKLIASAAPCADAEGFDEEQLYAAAGYAGATGP